MRVLARSCKSANEYLCQTEADFGTFQQSEVAEFTWLCFRNRVLKQVRIQPKTTPSMLHWIVPTSRPLSPGETLLLSHLTARFIGSSARGCMIPSHLSPDSGVIDSDLCERRLECQRENMCVSSHQLCSAPSEAITTETIRIPQSCCRESSETYRTFSHLWDQSTGNRLHIIPALNKKIYICIVC